MKGQAAADSDRYDHVAIGLHWLIAFLILLEFLSSVSFGQFNPGDPLYYRAAYDLHMAIGICVLIFSATRLGWRAAHRPPPLPTMHAGLRLLARASHALLYVYMLVVPAAGWLVLSVRHQKTSVFGLFSWAWPSLPSIATMPRTERQQYHDFLLPLHIDAAYAGLALVALHVVAALYHHFALRDAVFARMLPRWRSGTAGA